MKLVVAAVLTVFLSVPAFAQATNPSTTTAPPATGPGTTMGANTGVNAPTAPARQNDDMDWGWLGLLGLVGLAGLMPRKATVHHADPLSPGVTRSTPR